MKLPRVCVECMACVVTLSEEDMHRSGVSSRAGSHESSVALSGTITKHTHTRMVGVRLGVKQSPSNIHTGTPNKRRTHMHTCTTAKIKTNLSVHCFDFGLGVDQHLQLLGVVATKRTHRHTHICTHTNTDIVVMWKEHVVFVACYTLAKGDR